MAGATVKFTCAQLGMTSQRAVAARVGRSILDLTPIYMWKMDFSMPVYAFIRLLMGIKDSRRKRNDSKMTAVQTTASLRHASKCARVTLTFTDDALEYQLPDRRSILGFP